MLWTVCILWGSFSEGKREGNSPSWLQEEKEAKGVKKKVPSATSKGEDVDEAVWFPLPDIQKRLIYLHHTPRPDSSLEERSIYFGIEGTKEGVLALLGERVYLDCLDKETIRFSKEKTPFSIEPRRSLEGQLEVLFTVEYRNKEGGYLLRQESIFPVEAKPFPSSSFLESGSIGEMRRVLVGGKVYLPDLLRGRYGGEEFSKTSGLYRLELKEGKGEPLFFKVGDLFVWKEGKFSNHEEVTKGLPLLYVKAIQQGQCQCILWDETGLISCAIELLVVQPSLPTSKMQSILVRLHQRTDSSVTCLLRDKSMILKEGDWLLCSKEGWHNVCSARELKEYLRYALKGELFIFDAIVKNEAGTFFTGHLFDETRAICQKVELPLKKENLVKSPKGKKLLHSTTLGEETRSNATKGKMKNIVGCNEVLLEEEGDS
jgi:hypothetical protein